MICLKPRARVNIRPESLSGETLNLYCIVTLIVRLIVFAGPKKCTSLNESDISINVQRSLYGTFALM